MTHKDLIEPAYKWVLNSGKCGVAFKEFKTANCAAEEPDVIGFRGGGHSVLIECKASRSDFLADKKKRFRVYPELGMGSQRYFCCPSGMIRVEELPRPWGLIYVDSAFRCRRIIKAGRVEQKNLKAEHEVMYSALRRLHIRNRIPEVYMGLPEKESEDMKCHNRHDAKDRAAGIQERKRIEASPLFNGVENERL